MRVSESERDFNVWLEFQQKSIIILMLLSFHVTKAIVFFLFCLLFWEWDLYIWSCSLSPGVSTFLFLGYVVDLKLGRWEKKIHRIFHVRLHPFWC